MSSRNIKNKSSKHSTVASRSTNKVGKHTANIKTGSGGLKSTRKLNYRRVIPLVIGVALAGGYLVFQGFAGTYNICKTALSNDGNTVYNKQCVVDSEEASVIRLYQTVLNTTPEQKDVEFWSEKLLNKSATLTDVTRQFIESGDFKKTYGSLASEQFISLMYTQGLGRTPDAATNSYWQGRIASGASSRQSMVVALIQSDEMKNRLSDQVAKVLAITTFSTLDSSKRSIADGRSIVALPGRAGGECTIIVTATETWQKTSNKGTVDVSVSDQGTEADCTQYKLRKITIEYNARESGKTKVSAQNISSNTDVDERADFESLQVTVSQQDQVMRIDGASIELKDEANARCIEYKGDLNGNILTPSVMTQAASRKC